VDGKAKGLKVELVGDADLPGGKAHEIKVTLESGVVRRFWIDARTGLLMKSESTRKVRGHQTAFEVTYGDYRETGGVPFARTIEMGVRGRPQRLRIAVEKVELNPVLDESRFAAPR